MFILGTANFTSNITAELIQAKHYKKMNRKIELGLRNSEWLSVIANLKQGTSYPTEKLAGIWQILLRNQFHDIIPGSSIKEVYDDALIEYTEAMTENNTLISNQLTNLTTDADEKITLWNSSTWSRPRYIEISPTINRTI